MKTIDAIRHPLWGTQTALAEALGVAQPTVSGWGEYPPAIHQFRISLLTGMAVEPEVAQEYPELAAVVRRPARATRKAA